MGTIPNYQGYDIETIKGAGGAQFVKVYNDTGSAIADGAIKVLGFKVSTAGEILPVMIAPATEATVSNIIGVVSNFLMAGKSTIPAAEWGYLQIRGKCSAQVDGDTVDVAAGDQLEVLTTGTAFTSAEIATGNVLEAETVAIALEANTGAAALKNVWLIGRLAAIQAS